MSKTTITNEQLRDVMDESPASPEDNAGKLLVANANGKLPATVALSNKSQIDGLDGSGLTNLQNAPIFIVTASTTLITEAGGASHQANTGTWTKKKEILYKDVNGVITVRIRGRQGNNTSSSTMARIYKNGSAVGAQRTLTWSDTGGTTWDENFTVATNDLIQVYLSDTANRVAIIDEFSLRYTKGVIPATNTINL